MSGHRASCKSCGASLENWGEVTCVGYVSAADDPEGLARLDLVLDCEGCGAKFNAFVPLDDFHPIHAGA